MKKKIFTIAMMLGAATIGISAQDHIYLIKGNKVVAKYPMGSVDTSPLNSLKVSARTVWRCRP